MSILRQPHYHRLRPARHQAGDGDCQPSASVQKMMFSKKHLVRRLRSLALLNASFSHDLRNLFQPLLMIPDLLTYRTTDPHLHQLAKMVAECGRHGSALTETMLLLTRGSVAAHERIRIHDLFARVILLLKGSLPPNVTLHVRRHAKTLTVIANKTQLQQCLINLGLNAIQAMPQGGEVYFSATHQPNRRLCLSVEDTGIGMSDDIRHHIFEPFFTTKTNGTGLGLVSCKHIVDAHGGELRVSARVPHGTRFDLIMPIKEEPPHPCHAQRAEVPGDGRYDLRV